MLRNLTSPTPAFPKREGVAQSRRDGTLLTVDFNLRSIDMGRVSSLPSPAWDDTLSGRYDASAVPAGLESAHEAFCSRRLKSTVNRVPSLRDCSAKRSRSMVAERSRSMRGSILSRMMFCILLCAVTITAHAQDRQTCVAYCRRLSSKHHANS